MARILILDDVEPIRRLLGGILQSAGHETSEAANGLDGLRLVRAQPFELALCDLFMPVKDGLETIQELRRDHPQVKIIAMSGGGCRGSVDMLPAAVALGANHVLQKPFLPADVVQAVEETLHAK